MKLRVGYFDDSRKKGGTTRYLFDLIQGLDRARFEPVFYSSATRPWHDELLRLGVEIVPAPEPLPAAANNGLPPRNSSSPPHPSPLSHLPSYITWHMGLVRELIDLFRLFRKSDVDIFHMNNAGAEPAPVAAHWTGKPVIATLHVDPTYDLTGEHSTPRYRRLERLCLRACRCLIGVSDATGQSWMRRCNLSEEYAALHLRRIYNGIDLSSAEPKTTRDEARAIFDLAADAFVLSSVGRLEPAKGYEFLIRALPGILKSVPDTSVLIAGAGDLREPLEWLARELGVFDRVRFTGWLSDTSQVLAAGDLYVQPSLCEALSYSVLEACAAGLPLVITCVGGMPEILARGRNGVAVKPRDSDALARAVINLAADKRLLDDYGRRGKAAVREFFSVDRMQRETMAAYEAVASETRRKSSHYSCVYLPV